MYVRHRPRFVINCGIKTLGAILGLSLLGGCSSSFGGGSDPSQPHTVVIPPGARVVCQNGTAPPCE